MKRTGYIYNLKLFILCALLAANHSLYSSYTDENDYKESVKSVGFITDKSGAIASGFFINENTFITNHHVSNGLDVESAVIEMKDGTTFSVKKIIKE